MIHNGIWSVGFIPYRQDFLLQLCEVSLLYSECQHLIHVTLYIGQCSLQIVITDERKQI